MRTAVLTIIAIAALLAQPAFGAERFKDVPKDHWAAEYVAKVASDGIMKGYPDSKFKGDKAVTRYELAVALERMIEVIQNSLKPEKEAQSAKPKAQSQDPAQFLKSEGYIAANSPLLTNHSKTVSPIELAQALSSVASKLIEKTIPPPKDQ